MDWEKYRQAKMISAGTGAAFVEASQKNAEIIRKDIGEAIRQSSIFERAASREIMESIDLFNEGLQDSLSRIADGVENIDELVNRLGIFVNEASQRIILHLQAQNEILAVIAEAIPNPLLTSSKELKKRGEEALKNGWIDEAEADFREAIKLHYPDYIVHFYLGDIYLYHRSSKELPQAREYFLAAAKYAKPQSQNFASRAHYFAGFVSYLLKDLAGAIANTREAIGLNPNDILAQYMLAKYLALNKEAEESLQYLRQVIRADCDYVLKIALDHDFDGIRPRVDELILRLKNEVQSEVEKIERVILPNLQIAKAHLFAPRFKSALQEIENYIEKARKYLEGGDYIDAIRAKENIILARNSLQKIQAEIRGQELQEIGRIEESHCLLAKEISYLKKAIYFPRLGRRLKKKILALDRFLATKEKIFSEEDFAITLEYEKELSQAEKDFFSLRQKSGAVAKELKEKETVRRNWLRQQRRVNFQQWLKKETREEILVSLVLFLYRWVKYSFLGALMCAIFPLSVLINERNNNLETWFVYLALSLSIGFLLTFVDTVKEIREYMRRRVKR